MATLTIEVPDELITELKEHQVSSELIDLLVAQTIRVWLRKTPKMSLKHEARDGSPSPFAESAISFAEQLIDENRPLFERLAEL